MIFISSFEGSSSLHIVGLVVILIIKLFILIS